MPRRVRGKPVSHPREDPAGGTELWKREETVEHVDGWEVLGGLWYPIQGAALELRQTAKRSRVRPLPTICQ